MNRTRISIVLSACAALIAGGCGASRGAPQAKPQAARMNVLARMYASATGKLGRPPQNEAELKKFLAGERAKLEAAHVSSPDELFVSENDGAPLVIRYGPRPAGPGRDVIAYEKVGVDGKRFVAFSTGDAFALDEAKFRELIPN
jgi:hypothetical protein